MCADGSEHICDLWRVSIHFADINLPEPQDQAQLAAGDRIIAYIDEIGRLEGTVFSQQQDGFTLKLQLTTRQQNKLASKIAWLVKNIGNNEADQRRHNRYIPARTEAVLALADGTEHECKILDLSLSGAAVQTSLRPPLRSIVTLGNSQAKVMRHFDDGIGLEFLVLQTTLPSA